MVWFALAAAAVQAVGQRQQAEAQQQADNYNATIEQQRGQQATLQAAAQSQQDAVLTRRKLGEAQAAYGAAGVDVGQGTPLAVLSDLATQGELTRQLTLYKGTTTANADQEQAALDVTAGDNAAAAGRTNSYATLLSAGSKAAGANYTPSAPPQTGY